MSSDALKLALQVVHEVRAMIAIGSSNIEVSGITPDLISPNDSISSHARTGGWAGMLLVNHLRREKKLLWKPTVNSQTGKPTKSWTPSASSESDYDFKTGEDLYSKSEKNTATEAVRACLYKVGNCGEMADLAVIKFCYLMKRVHEKNNASEIPFSIKIVEDNLGVDHATVVFTYNGVSAVCDAWLDHAFEVTPAGLYIFKRMLEMARSPIDETLFQEFADKITGKKHQCYISISTYAEATKMIALFEKLYLSALKQDRLESTSVSYSAMISTFAEKYNSIELKETKQNTIKNTETYLTEQSNCSPLETAIAYENDTAVARLLRSGAEITDTCIAMALMGINTRIVDLLYQFKPDLQATFLKPKNLLLEHIKRSNVPMIITLMKHNVITKEMLKCTEAFFYAAASKNRKLMQFLLQLATPHDDDKNGTELKVETVEFILRIGQSFDMNNSIAKKALAYIIENEDFTKDDLHSLELFLSKGAEISDSLFAANKHQCYKIYKNALTNNIEFPFTFQHLAKFYFPIKATADLDTAAWALEQGETAVYATVNKHKIHQT